MIVALDLGTSTGFAAKDSGGSIIHSRWDFKPRRFEGGGMRFLRFRQQLAEVHGADPIEILFFEEVRAHKGVDAAHVYGGLLGTLTAFCEERKIPYEGVPVGAIKRFWTGKGNAPKEAMVAQARAHGYTLDDAAHDEADAIAILHLKLTELGK